MKTTRSIVAILAALPLAALTASPPATPPYHIGASISLGGSGHWDYLVADAAHARLYVTHNTTVEVVDTTTRRRIGSVAVGGFSHGVAIAAIANRGYVTSGESSVATTLPARQVVAFDLRTLRVVKRLTVPADPDGIIYEPRGQRVLAFSGDTHTATVIDARTGRRLAAIGLDGSPEASVADGNGNIFVNVGNRIVAIDAAAMRIKRTIPLRGCDTASGLAIDTARALLFSACDNRQLFVVDARRGSVLTRIPVAPKNDGVAYDAHSQTLFVTTLLGAMSIIRRGPDGRYLPIQTLRAPIGSRTAALDERTHLLYLSAARFEPLQAGQRYPTPVPGSFHVIVVGSMHPR